MVDSICAKEFFPSCFVSVVYEQNKNKKGSFIIFKGYTMKVPNPHCHKIVALESRSSDSRRQSYYRGKYRREVFYIGLSVILILLTVGFPS